MARSATYQQKRTLEQRPWETVVVLCGNHDGGFKNIEGSAVGADSEDDLKGLFDDLDVNSGKLGLDRLKVGNAWH